MKKLFYTVIFILGITITTFAQNTYNTMYRLSATGEIVEGPTPADISVSYNKNTNKIILYNTLTKEIYNTYSNVSIIEKYIGRGTGDQMLSVKAYSEKYHNWYEINLAFDGTTVGIKYPGSGYIVFVNR